MLDSASHLFNAPGDDLNSIESVLRSAIVYLLAIAIVRFGKKRFFAQATAFEVVLGVMLGSVMSRSINGSGNLWPSLAATLALVVMHWLFSLLAFHVSWFSDWIRGHTYVLVEDGKLDEAMMKRHHLTDQDLDYAMRKSGMVEDVTAVKRAVLEQNGEISVIAYA